MTYRPKGASLPQRFKKENTSSDSSFKQYPQSRRAVVDSYDISGKPSENSILATEVGTGRKLKIKINPDKLGNGPRSAADKWNGNMIDERMAKSVEPGETIALDSCITEKNDEKAGYSIMRTNWIIQDQAPEKTFQGFITASSYNDHVTALQAYGEMKNINPGTEEGLAAVTDLGEKMDAACASYKAGERPVTYGVKFHAMVKVGEKDGVPEYEVINRTPPFDWIRAEKNSSDEVISGGHPMNREYLEEYLDGYLDYVYGSEDQSVENAEPGLVSRGVISADAEVIVEVMPFRAFAVSSLSKYMETSNPRAPLSVMCNVMTKFGQEDDNGYVGKNWARKAVVLFTSDQAPEKRDGEWKTRNLATRALVYGRQGDIDAMLPAFDGGRIRIHPSLAAQRDYPVAGEPSNNASASAGSASSGSGSPQFSAPDIDLGEDDDVGNYFANQISSAQENAVLATETPVDQKPAETEQKASASESPDSESPASESPKSGGRFQRRST